jgi:hypothetical protein
LSKIHPSEANRLPSKDLGDREQVLDLPSGKIPSRVPSRGDREGRVLQAEQGLQIELERGVKLARIGEALLGAADRIGQKVGGVAGSGRNPGGLDPRARAASVAGRAFLL